MVPNRKVLIKKLSPDVKTPTKGNVGDAGYDIRTVEELKIYPLQTRKVRTGICVKIPFDKELQLRPRSGLSSQGVIVTLGTIDSGYTGEICVIVTFIAAPESPPYFIQAGDRIGQLVLARRIDIDWIEVDELPDTERGGSGFGSTGVE